MCTQLITKFKSVKEWKNYCFSANSSYFKNPHFRKWINKKDIYIFNFSNIRKGHIQSIKLGIQDAIKMVGLHFKIHYSNDYTIKKVINLTNEKIYSNELLKMVIKERKKNHKDHAYIFIFNKQIESREDVIRDGEALTYVSEGVMILTFDVFKSYPHSFLRRRAKHEAIHLLGLNSHHENTSVKGYANGANCVMRYNAPTMNLCKKCKDAIVSFWNGIKYATKKQYIKN